MRGSRLCRSNNHEEGALEWLILLWRERRHWMCAAEGWPAESTRIRCGLKEKVAIVAGEGYCYCYRQLCGSLAKRHYRNRRKLRLGSNKGAMWLPRQWQRSSEGSRVAGASSDEHGWKITAECG
ncbi:hypothetical protein BHE74_00022400 [Ensete ventricosum]|nr:hypothetical protein BHE74_00022400 [Ensete ventricosum]